MVGCCGFARDWVGLGWVGVRLILGEVGHAGKGGGRFLRAVWFGCTRRVYLRIVIRELCAKANVSIQDELGVDEDDPSGAQ